MFFHTSNAQKCKLTLKGKITDFHDSSLITGASVQIINLNKYTTSNIAGEFEFNDLCLDKLIIEIKHIACETKKFTIDLTKNTFRNVTLEHHLEELEEVQLKIDVKKETKTAQETVIKNEVLTRYSGLNLGDALKEIPGVSSINTGNGIVKPMINGMHSSRILTITNGVRLQDQEWGIEHSPNIDINSANQISVIKGAGALAYGGDAIGGVVIINPQRIIRKDTLFGHTILGGNSNGRGYHVSTTLNKNYETGWFTQVQGSYKRNGDFNAPDYSLTNTGLKSNGFNTRFGKNNFQSGFEINYSYLYNKIGILRSAHIGNIKSLASSINAEEPLFADDFSYDINPPKQEITHHLFKAKYYKRIKNFGKVDVQYDFQNNRRFEFDIRRGGRSVKSAIDLELQTHTISLNANVDNNLERKYDFGILGRYQNNFANPDTGVRRLIPDYDKYDFGGYATTEWKLNDSFLVDAGLRYDFSRIDALKFYKVSAWDDREYDENFRDIIIGSVVNNTINLGVIDPNASQYLVNAVFNFHNISTSAGLKYMINNKNQILFNYNLASRPPNVSELFSDGLHHSAARIETGDINIDSERSNRISSTYDYFGSKLNLRVESFYNHIHNFIYLVPGSEGIIPLIRGPFPAWEYIQTDAVFYGIDVSANYQMTNHWSVNHKSSFIKGQDKLAKLPLIDIPPFTTLNSITYSNSKWYNFNASLQSELVLEQNEYPDEFNFTVPIANEDDIFVDLSPPAGYHLMHFQSEITLPVSKQSNLNIRFSVDNVFNTNYRNYLNRLRFFSDDLGRNFRLQIQLNY
jgi:iron complex outermembrane receptor protein